MTEYREGTIFAVPLSNSEFVLGLIARQSLDGVLLVYFFEPFQRQLPTMDMLNGLTIDRSFMVERIGDLFIHEGKWKIIGNIPHWDRIDWPMPKFIREELITGRKFLVHYDDANPNKVLKEVLIKDNDEAKRYTRDKLMGAESVVITLKKNFSQK